MTIGDAPKSYALAIAAMREKGIRAGTIAPRAGDVLEAQWAAEGVVADRDLAAVKHPAHGVGLLDLRQMIEQTRVDLSTEKAAQRDLEEMLTGRGVAFDREARLNDADVPDFLVAGGIVIEVKIGGSAPSIYRQLKRYAAHETVTALLLVTAVAMSLPSQIEGKATAIARLGVSWV